MLIDIKQKAQVTIPKKVMDKLGLQIGDKVEIDTTDCQITITPVVIVPKDQFWFYSKRLFNELDIEMTGENLEKEMLKTGYSKEYAKKHAEAYNKFLSAQKNKNLTSW